MLEAVGDRSWYEDWLTLNGGDEGSYRVILFSVGSMAYASMCHCCFSSHSCGCSILRLGSDHGGLTFRV